MKKKKNRMQIKALKNTSKNFESRLKKMCGSYQLMVEQLNAETAVYKNRLQMACDVIGSNDLLRAMLCDAQLITYDGPDYMRVPSRQPRMDFAVPSGAAIAPELFTTDFIYRFGQFVQDNIEKVHFGKVYEVNHNGKRQCLFLDEQAIGNVPFDYLASRYLPELIGGLKDQCSRN